MVMVIDVTCSYQHRQIACTAALRAAALRAAALRACTAPNMTGLGAPHHQELNFANQNAKLLVARPCSARLLALTRVQM